MQSCPSFQSAGSFSEGCAPAKKRGLWGCVDKDGKAAVPFEYEELLPFREGAAPISTVLEAQRTARETLATYIDDLARAWIAIATERVLTLTTTPDRPQ